ncbi:hypothetical protein SAMN04487895_11458 [Paenibacillus sophorae]|uniref:Uncharacterized protein n=1 Tax=Paenibacillus sophorae TaxID=1333845 RepID=A0A1H8TI46_9BACL|nr:hypothetical protein SAMN04487895_11458 [Paenibacillus sophorae]
MLAKSKSPLRRFGGRGQFAGFELPDQAVFGLDQPLVRLLLVFGHIHASSRSIDPSKGVLALGHEYDICTAVELSGDLV